jgi:hypothetical protein
VCAITGPRIAEVSGIRQRKPMCLAHSSKEEEKAPIRGRKEMEKNWQSGFTRTERKGAVSTLSRAPRPDVGYREAQFLATASGTDVFVPFCFR